MTCSILLESAFSSLINIFFYNMVNNHDELTLDSLLGVSLFPLFAMTD